MVLWWKKKQRVRADLVVGIMFFNPDGEVLLVQKDGKLTIPTGHMEEEDESLEHTVQRESGEELHVRLSVRITGNFGSYISEGPDKKLIEIFSSRLTREEAKQVNYEEAGQRGQLWVRPSRIKNLSLLDSLASLALEKYCKRFSERKNRKGDKNGSAVKISQSIQPV